MTRMPGGLWMMTGTLVLAALPAAADVKVEGYAEWRRGGCLVVDAQRVCPSAGMRLKAHGGAQDFASIPLGYEVKARGERTADGTLVARELEAKPNGSAMFERDLAREFDEVERIYVEHGRVFDLDDEGRMGDDYGRLVERGPDLARVESVLDDLVPPYLDPDRFRIYVVDNEEWNAMAAPNGALFVFTGLLDDLDDDELAIILGHELAHATHEHGRKSFKKGLWTQVAMHVALAAAEEIDSKGARIAAQGATLLAGLALSASHGRKLEDQADRVGLRYAYEAGYDVSKAPRLWERFAERYGSLPKVVHFFVDEHSRSQDRAVKLAAEIRTNYDGAALLADRAAAERDGDTGRVTRRAAVDPETDGDAGAGVDADEAASLEDAGDDGEDDQAGERSVRMRAGRKAARATGDAGEAPRSAAYRPF